MLLLCGKIRWHIQKSSVKSLLLRWGQRKSKGPLKLASQNKCFNFLQLRDWQTQNTPILSHSQWDTCSVLYNLPMCSWVYSSAGSANQRVLGAGSLRGYPSFIPVLDTTTLVILMLFYQDRNSSKMSFRKTIWPAKICPLHHWVPKDRWV